MPSFSRFDRTNSSGEPVFSRIKDSAVEGSKIERTHTADGTRIESSTATQTRLEPQLGGTPAAPIVVAVPVFEPQAGVLKETEPSQELFFDTVFADFSLTAQPVYNFFVPGEESDETVKQYESVEDLPRYVFLRWSLPPDYSLSYGVNPINSRADITKNGRVFNVAGISFSYADVFKFSDMRKLWANGYYDSGFIEMKTSTQALAMAESTVDEELYILSGLKTPIADLSSNDRGVRDSVPYDPYGSAASAVTEDVDPLADLKIDPPIDQDERMRVKAAVDLMLDTLDDTVLSRIVSREAAEVALSISGMAGQLKLLSSIKDVSSDLIVEPPVAPAPSELPEVEYIGFLIEKYVLVDGAFQFRDLIEISDPRKGFYIDTQVAYGQVVRYRMLSVMRWTHSPQKQLRLGAKVPALPSGVLPLLQKTAHVIFSGWSEHATAVVWDLQPPRPPEQIFVRPLSKQRRVQICWVVPDDDQNDISGFHLYRRPMRAGAFVGPWENLGKFPNRNGSFFDDVPFFEDKTEGYVYAMSSFSVHSESSKLSEQIFCSLNREYKHEGERHVRQVSQAGATMECHGACSFRPFREEPEHVVAKRKVTLYQRTGPSRFVNQDSTVTLRLESLDTGETRDVSLSLKYVAVEAPLVSLPPPGRIPAKNGEGP